jgi:hypothetical protein
LNARQAATAARRFQRSGIEVLGTDEGGNPKFGGATRVIIRNPATRRKLYYQSYD